MLVKKAKQPMQVLNQVTHPREQNKNKIRIVYNKVTLKLREKLRRVTPIGVKTGKMMKF
ncbi:hypothetical protein [Wolbachia endosymbiont (group A) of Andrena carantonica]|uniref:hypothetical protein n=1 Tax=Wolbachia endosymbiont (group A) of Andrena carantonica TaxID=3066190 RepID=UPI0031333004